MHKTFSGYSITTLYYFEIVRPVWQGMNFYIFPHIIKVLYLLTFN